MILLTSTWLDQINVQNVIKNVGKKLRKADKFESDIAAQIITVFLKSC